MAGVGTNSQLTPPLSNPQSDVSLWNNGWVSLQPGFGNTTSEFGPELSFGRAIADALLDDDIYLVKHAISGTNLDDQWDPGSGPQYADFKAKADAALTNLDNAGIDYQISGMLWMQGESDAMDASDAAAYEANLINLIATVRSEFATLDLPFIMGRILTGYGTPSNNTLVREAQVDVAGDLDGVFWIDTDALQLGTPGHYGTEGQIELGNLFAQQNLSAIPEPQSWLLMSLSVLGLSVIRKRLFLRSALCRPLIVST